MLRLIVVALEGQYLKVFPIKVFVVESAFDNYCSFHVQIWRRMPDLNMLRLVAD